LGGRFLVTTPLSLSGQTVLCTPPFGRRPANGGRRASEPFGSLQEGDELPLFESAWGHEITIETQSTTPAGWYADPAGSGGKRWWDGVQWTTHLQAAAPPQVAVQPQRVDPYAQASNPYGLGAAQPAQQFAAQLATQPAQQLAAQERPYVPMQNVYNERMARQQEWNSQAFNNQQLPTVGVGYAISGLVFFALSLVGLIPQSPIYFLSYGAIFAVIGGIRILGQRSKGRRLRLWPPVIALVFGLIAILISGSEFALNTIARTDGLSAYNSGLPVQGTQGADGQSGDANLGSGAQGGAQGTTLNASMPAPPTFAGDSALTTYEASARNIATSLYASYNGGVIGTPGAQWPATLTENADGTVSFPSGTVAAQIPADQDVKYEVSSDGKYFDVAVSAGNHQELAIYDSENNVFTWMCDTGAPASCPAGGVSPDSGSGTVTSNS
jgi:hypothetical protein